MLLALLWRRWRAGGAPLVVLPCELISRNGRVLHDTVLALARDLGAEAAFTRWLDEGVVWADTLVDRIVSQAIEPIGAVAEPYALWAIERRPGLKAPCEHPAIVMVDDLEPFERLKLHVLNLGHTFLADIWLKEGRPAGETVRGILADARVREQLDELYRREVLPGFAARGLESEAAAYVATTMDRFLNPFLDHLVADIAQNHAPKVERRIAAFLDWRAAGVDRPPAAPVLEAIVDSNRGESEGDP
jgi:tagaturonate reductase